MDFNEFNDKYVNKMDHKVNHFLQRNCSKLKNMGKKQILGKFLTVFAPRFTKKCWIVTKNFQPFKLNIWSTIYGNKHY